MLVNIFLTWATIMSVFIRFMIVIVVVLVNIPNREISVVNVGTFRFAFSQ